MMYIFVVVVSYFNWELTEEDLHSWIVEAYENMGYQSLNFHTSGASVEKGIDLLFNKQKKSIAVAVKIKPSTQDIPQLERLLSNRNKELIYIFVKSPTKPFYEKIEDYRQKGLISFLDATTLHNFLLNNKSLNYVRHYIFNHPTFNHLLKTLIIWNSVNQAKRLKPSISEIRILWRIKDKSVSFHKKTDALFDYLNHKLYMLESEEELPYVKVLDYIMDSLSYLDTEVQELMNLYKSLRQENPSVLSYMWGISRERSVWCRILGPIQNHRDEKKVLFNWFYNNSPAEPYTLLIHFCEQFSSLGEEFENTIDWTFDDLLSSNSQKRD